MATSDSTLDFGQRLLALLDTGSFTTSYKYATLLALIDEVMAGVGPDGAPPRIVRGRAVARRVFALYWPQARPFSARGPLRQSNVAGDIVSKIAATRADLGIAEHVGLARARLQHPAAIDELEARVEKTVLRYPLPLLQWFGSGGASATEDRFVYDYDWAEGAVPADDTLRLAPGAGAHLSALAGLVRPVIQREWLHFVARRNSADLDELRVERFLFGADRTALAAVRAPLLALQGDRCFYCDGASGPWEVDHFLPWARWPDDALDNLVVAHRACNNDKRAALAGVDHLARWWPRFRSTTPTWATLERIATRGSWPRTPAATAAGARALYLHQPPGTMLWRARGAVEALDPHAIRSMLLDQPAPLDQAAEADGGYQP